MLSDYAAFAEIIASLGVVISLIYVARQLKQNTDAMKVTTSTHRIDRDFAIVEPMLGNRELAEIWMKGGEEFATLDAVDRQRLLFFERRALLLWYSLFRLYKKGLLEEEIWKEQEWIILNIGQRQAVHEAWNIFRGAFNQEFQDYIDSQFNRQEHKD